jgi:hypothetical protein
VYRVYSLSDLRILVGRNKNKNKKGGVFLLAYGVRSFGGCVVVDGLTVGLFAVASTLYVTVNFAPLSVWNASALPTNGVVPDGTGSNEGINCDGPIKVIATAPVGGLAISGTP